MVSANRNKPKVSKAKVAQPKVTKPKVTKTKSAQLKISKPKVTKAKAAQPKLAKPKVTKAKVAQPKVAKPKVTKTKSAQPKSAQPKSAQLKIAKPKVTKAKVAQPRLAKPKVTKTKSAQLKIAKPKVTKAKVAKPKVTKTKSAQLKIAKPKVTKAKVAHPKIAKPKVTKAKVAQSTVAKPKTAKTKATKPKPRGMWVPTYPKPKLDKPKPTKRKVATAAIMAPTSPIAKKSKHDVSMHKSVKGFEGMGSLWGNKIYQLNIRLEYSNPPIWRRILIPECCTFQELHCAIQSSMGWKHCHLHEFHINPKAFGEGRTCIGVLSDDFGGRDVIPGELIPLSAYFKLGESTVAIYIYDFGDNWEHQVFLEKILPAEKNVVYPQCIDGKRACPPENCGSIEGYENIVEIMADRKHKERPETLEWLQECHGKFNPEKFNPKTVVFWNPYH